MGAWTSCRHDDDATAQTAISATSPAAGGGERAAERAAWGIRRCGTGEDGGSDEGRQKWGNPHRHRLSRGPSNRFPTTGRPANAGRRGTLEEGPGIDEEGLQNLEKLKLNEGKVGQRRLRESRLRATHGEGGYRRVEQGFDGKNEPNCCRNSS